MDGWLLASRWERQFAQECKAIYPYMAAYVSISDDTVAQVDAAI